MMQVDFTENFSDETNFQLSDDQLISNAQAARANKILNKEKKGHIALSDKVEILRFGKEGFGEEDSKYIDAWKKVLEKLQGELTQHIFDAFIKDLAFVSSNEEDFSIKIQLGALSTLVKNRVECDFIFRIQELFSLFLEKQVSIALKLITIQNNIESNVNSSSYIVIKKPALSAEDKATTAEALENKPSPFIYSGLNQRYTFSNFVVGNSNQFVHAAAQQVAEKPGESYNPLFIYGGVGLGKTHLLHAIGNYAKEINPEIRIAYYSSEAFTTELIQALRTSSMDGFKKKLRSIEVLLIDDIQFMVGKERTQEEFFHTFNALYSAKRQIVLTSDKMPSEIPQIEERLSTRFSWGLTADIQAPDFETRVAILNKKSQVDGFFLPNEVSNILAERITSNVRELEGALTKLHAVSSIERTPISVELTHRALKHLFEKRNTCLSMDEIKKCVANYFNIKVSDIISKNRARNVSFPRHIAIYLSRKHTPTSYMEIGDAFGGRDHSSVIHASNVVTEKLKIDSSVKNQISELERELFK